MKNKTQLITIFFGAVIALVCIGCTPTVDNSNGGIEIEPSAPDQETSTSNLIDDLVNIDWDLILLGDVDVSGKGATIQFSDKSVSGSDGCNHFSGGYTMENNQIVFGGPFISTQMACEDMETPAKYLEALSAGGDLSLKDGLLTIQSETGALVFEVAKASELENTTWTLGGLNTGDAVVSMAIDQNIFILIEGNSFTGIGGCNNIGGGVQIDNNKISFKELFATEMFCEGEGLMERESELIEALSRVISYEIVRQSLTLLDANDEMVATFYIAGEDIEEEMSIDQSESIDNKTWALMHMIVGGDALVAAPTGTNITMEINNGNVSGNSGCNMFNGAVILDRGTLTMGPLVTTRRACAEEVMNFESAILAQLEQVGGYFVDGNLLVLTTADGLPLAEFTTVETKMLFVGSEQVDCEGVAPQKCLLVKEDQNEEYSYFYDVIGGFEWEAGFDYELLVNVTENNEPLADASSFKYTLVQIVSKTRTTE